MNHSSDKKTSEQTAARFVPDRRDALKLLASGSALALSACGPPKEEIVPYVEMPEGLVPGVPMQFATALPLSGYARGVVVTSHEGRPTKIDGNPRHPASFGASDIFTQAEIMTLYDPDRLGAVRNAQGLSSWNAFSAALLTQMEREKERQGSGLRLLTGRITSPTLLRQIQGLLKSFPGARWLRYEPVSDDAERTGAMLAFSKRMTVIPRIADTTVLLALDADLLGPGPDQIRIASEFANRRRIRSPALAHSFMRLYVIEPCWTLTGANADERMAVARELIRNAAIEIANVLGASIGATDLPDDARRFVEAAAADLQANPGRAIVLAGHAQPAEVHALCHWINDRLQAPRTFIEPVDPSPLGHGQSLRQLLETIESRETETLFIIDSNPAYAAPGELHISEAIARTSFSAHLGMYDNETASVCQWKLPLSHMLESWSDLRAFDGTASIVQPLIRPLYDTRTAHELLALIDNQLSASSYDLVRDTWRPHVSQDFEKSWRRWLNDGVIPDTAQNLISPPSASLPSVSPAAASSTLSLALSPDPSLWDGRFSNNAWLQECPKPLTKEVWGNALDISPKDAQAFNLQTGDVVTLARGALAIEAPVRVREGQAEGVLGATLGYGRRRAGAIGSGVGFDAFVLRTLDNPWTIDGLTVSKTSFRKEILSTQRHFALDAESKDILPSLSMQEMTEGKVDVPENGDLPTLLPDWKYESYKWAMVIDTTLCIGCNACLIACQSENNVPIVGPAEVAVGREMHWLRIDAYQSDSKPLGFQPVPCMHCEKAPCEPVCPVAASVHDSEGLNVQVYNRCIGTRFCQSNCPYKVRRFNFFGYATDEAYANLSANVVEALFNPDVSVRARGVMEKCTYCVQRISRARRAAEKEGRRIREGEVVTACQAACPTRAITFGDLNDEASQINALRKEPHHYAMLGHLGTRPRTTYLARLNNPNPTLRDRKT